MYLLILLWYVCFRIAICVWVWFEFLGFVEICNLCRFVFMQLWGWGYSLRSYGNYYVLFWQSREFRPDYRGLNKSHGVLHLTFAMNYGMLESFVSYGSLTRRNSASYMPVMQLTSAIILIGGGILRQSDGCRSPLSAGGFRPAWFCRGFSPRLPIASAITVLHIIVAHASI